MCMHLQSHQGNIRGFTQGLQESIQTNNLVLWLLQRPPSKTLPRETNLVVVELTWSVWRKPIFPNEVRPTIRVDEHIQGIAYWNAIILLLRKQCLQTTVCESHASNTPSQDSDIDVLLQTTTCFQFTQIDCRAVDYGWRWPFTEVLKTERVGFEPTRVLPLHDFESCAINRTLPPLHTPSGVLAV